MKQGIRTYNDLLAERKRLEGILAVQRDLIRTDVTAMKEELKPIKNAIKFVGKFTSKDKSNPLLNMGVDFLGDLVLKNVLFAKSGLITKLIGPFILKNFSSNLLSQSGAPMRHQLMDRIHQITNLFRKKSNGVKA